MDGFILDEKRVQSCIDNYKRTKEDVAQTAIRAGRSADDVRLMCVTKTVEPEYINPVLDLGADLIGENRVQVALEKIHKLPEEVRKNSRFHLIGHLQTNKVKDAVGNFHMIHSVDSLKLAKAISKEAEKKGLEQKILLQVNNAHEEQKFGFDTDELWIVCLLES